MSQDTSDDGGGDDEEQRCQLQMTDNTLATATHNTYSTPSTGLKNKPISKFKLVHVVTPTDNNTPSNTIQPASITNKATTTDAHEVCIDMDTVDKKAPKIGVEIIVIDMDGDNTDTEANNDDNKIPGLDKNEETDSPV